MSPTAITDYIFRDGLLLFRGRLVLPSDSPLRVQLLEEFHSSPIGGHAGVYRTFHRLSSNFFWKGMRKDVQTFVSSCQVCQQIKDLYRQPAGLLQPLPVPDLVFEEITMDFITCLPSSKGKATIMMVVDRLSKYAHFVALPSTFTAQTMAVIFVAEIIRLHGPPKVIVIDRDPRFMNSFWKEIHRLQGTTLSMSTAYHPQTDGQSEALNKCVEQYLHCFVMDIPHEWSPLLPWAEYWYNIAYQTSARMTPFQALYGCEPPTLVRYALGSSSNDSLSSTCCKGMQ